MEKWGAILYSFLRKPPPSVSLRSPPTPKTGVGKHSGGGYFLKTLPPPACQGEGDRVSGGRGAAAGGLYKRKGAFKHQAVSTTVYHRFLIPPSGSLRSPPTPKQGWASKHSGGRPFSLLLLLYL